MPEYKLFAEARYGDNSIAAGGEHELAVGESSTNMSTAHFTWDTDLSNGLDSGAKKIALDVPASNTNPLTWQVGKSHASHSGATYGSLLKIVLRVGVLLEAAVALTGVTVTFSGPGGASYTYGPTDGPAVDQRNLTGAAEASIEITPPSGTTFTSATVTGAVRLRANAGVSLGAGDAFAQVFVAAL
jgi:hypothetical protein